VGGRWEVVVRDPLHVVAGVQDDGARWRVEADPLPVLPIEHLEPFDVRGRKDGEEVDVFVPQQTPRSGAGVFVGDRRVVVESQSEVGSRELLVVVVRVDPEIPEDALRDRQDEPLVRERESAEERLRVRDGPEVGRAVRSGTRLAEVERAAAEHPPFDEIRVDVGGLLDGEVSLLHRTNALRCVAELLVERGTGEHVDHALARFGVESRVDAMSHEDRESDLCHGLTELLGEGRRPGFATLPQQPHVARLDLEFLVELFVGPFGQVVFVRPAHLVVPLELLADGGHAVLLLRCHRIRSPAGREV
jgi:hypothetical protein